MRVWISTDMEGVGGVVNREFTGPSGSEYGAAREWLTREVNAVAEACFENGAEEVLVTEAHGGAINILREILHPEAELLNGKVTSLPYIAATGLTEDFDAAFLVGYHVRAGRHPGILDHTAWAQTVAEVRVNGMPVGESELAGGYAGALGVPLLMAVGDDALAEDIQQTMPGVKGVAVKHALNRLQARHMSPTKTYDLIKRSAVEALRSRDTIEPFTFAAPTTMELDFKAAIYADLAEMVPLCERTGLMTVAFTGEDFVKEVYPAFCSMCGISAIAFYQGG